jgi:hypothetical protein
LLSSSFEGAVVEGVVFVVVDDDRRERVEAWRKLLWVWLEE